MRAPPQIWGALPLNSLETVGLGQTVPEFDLAMELD